MKILGTTKKTALALCLLVLSVTSLLSAKAKADSLTINLASPVQTGAPGSTLSFYATVLAPSTNGGTLFLNAADYTTNGVTLDYTPFFDNFPFTLDPGESAAGLLFTVNVLPSTQVGIYLGSFRILGGSTFFSLENLGGANFEVDVPATSAVPEPGSILLLMTGLPGVAVLVRSKRHLFTKSNG